MRRQSALGKMLLLATMFALCLPACAVGQMPASMSVEALRHGAPPDAEAIYRLQITSGSDGAAFGIHYQLPDWPTREAVLGSPLRIVSVQLLGPGSIEPAKPPLLPKPVLPLQNVCRRERTTPFGNEIWVQVAPSSTAMVELRAKATYPIWPGTKNSVSFFTFSANEPAAPRALLGGVTTPRVGPVGTHIQMRTVGKPRNDHRLSPEVVGRTVPPLRFGRIAVRAVKPLRSGSVLLSNWGAKESVSLGSFRTDHRGRFRVPPRSLPTFGKFAVLARSEGRGGRAADWNCGAFFGVR
jgi:hypothetical protein